MNELNTSIIADIDECASNTDNCNDNAECSNSNGTFTCTCNTGYTGDGVTCDGNIQLIICVAID